MVQASHPHWKRRRSSAATRAAVVAVLQANGPLTALDIACETRKLRRAWVCVALDDLRVKGRVVEDGGKFELVRTTA